MNLCSPSLSVSESGNEELCSELSPVLDERSRRSLRCCVDGVSDSPYASSNLRTDGQPNCSGSDCLQYSFPDGKPGRGLPSIDDKQKFKKSLLYKLHNEVFAVPKTRINTKCSAHLWAGISPGKIIAGLIFTFFAILKIPHIKHVKIHLKLKQRKGDLKNE